MTADVEPPLPLQAPMDLELLLRARREVPAIVAAQLFVKGRRTGAWREEASARFALATDGAWHRYLVSLSRQGMPAQAVGIRLDPFEGDGSLEVARARLVPHAPPGPTGSEWRRDGLERDWLPGPGIEPAADAARRVRGPDAWLLGGGDVEIDAGRVTQIEIRMATSDGRPGRLCYGGEQLGPDVHCVPLPAALPGADATHYLDMLLKPGWTGHIRRLRLEPLGPEPAIGATFRVDWIKAVALHAGPLTSVFVRRADFFQRVNPTRGLASAAFALAAFLTVVAIALERLAPPRGVDGPRPLGPQRAVEITSLGAVLLGLALLALFPFESFPPLRAPFFHASLDVPGVFLLLAAAVGAARRLLYLPAPTLLPAVERPAALLAVILAIASLASADPTTSLAYLERHFLMTLAALLAGAWAPVTRRTFPVVLGTIVALLGFLAVVGLVQALGFKDFLYGSFFRAFQPHFFHANIRPKPFASIGHPVPFATVLLVWLPVGIFTALRASGRLRIAAIAASTLGFSCLCLTFGRGAALALLAAIPFLLKLVPRPLRRRAAALAGIAVLAAAAIAIARTPRGEVRPMTTRGIAKADEGAPSIWGASQGRNVFVAHRVLGLRVALDIFRHHPMAGIGLGRFPAVYDQYLPRGVLHRNPIWSTADDSYLTILAEAGAPALLALLLFLGAIARVGWLVATRRADGDDGPLGWATLASLAGFVTHLAIYDGLYWYTAMMLAAPVLGLCLAALDHMGRERLPRPPGAPCP